MNEADFEKAAKVEQEQRDKAIQDRVQYNNFSTICTYEKCGVTLPEVRWKIGICMDCSEDIEREKEAKKRNGV